MNKPITDMPDSGTPDIATSEEVRWPLRNRSLGGLAWRNPEAPSDAIPIIGLHGWLDNAATFSRVGPELAKLGSFFSIDFAGHGHSYHRPPGQSYPLLDHVADIAELIDQHFDGPVHIVGHSMGGIIGSLYASSFPERVARLVMIDSLGPLTQPPEEAPGQLRKALRKHIRGSGAAMTYPSLDDAVKIRAGGLSPLSSEAAHILVPRNLREVEGGYQWRTDARLRYPSLSRLHEEQVASFLMAIEAPSLLLKAEDGLLGGRQKWQARAALIPDFREVTVSGSHHCHLDGNVQPVIESIRAFLHS